VRVERGARGVDGRRGGVVAPVDDREQRVAAAAPALAVVVAVAGAAAAAAAPVVPAAAGARRQRAQRGGHARQLGALHDHDARGAVLEDELDGRLAERLVQGHAHQVVAVAALLLFCAIVLGGRQTAAKSVCCV